MGTTPSKLSQLLQARGGRPSKTTTIALDGEQVPVTFWVLTNLELAQAHRAALDFLRASLQLKELGLESDIGDAELTVQMLAVALRDPANPSEPFASAAELRGALSADEITAAFHAYLDFADERSPIRKFRSAEEVGAFVDAVGKGSIPRTELISYDTVSLATALLFAAARSPTSTKRSSSACSAASASPTSGGPTAAGG